MSWGFLCLMILFCILRRGYLLLWKGAIWRGISWRNRIGCRERVFILGVRIIVSHAIIFTFLYIGEELLLGGFILTTALFVSSILILIIRDSLFSLLLGWDGLGASSLFLIIWYQRWNRIDRGVITFLSNRLGDFFLILRLLVYSFIGGWSFTRRRVNACFTFFITIACFTKRAQVPLRVWLPIAISAPTPISALVHSRTLVTAGIFLSIKLQCLLSSGFLLVLGVATIVVRGRIRVFEIDLKKIIALSTLSQLGLMRVRVGTGALGLTFFHIIRHALTKRALFIVAGTILHSNLGTQDKRLLSWGKRQRYSFISLCVCSLSLCGICFTRGAVRKELILLWLREGKLPILIVCLITGGVALTFVYCIRIFLVCLQSLRIRIKSRKWSSKEIRRRVGLVFIRCAGGWRFRESFFVRGTPLSSWERRILLFLLLISFFFYWLPPNISSFFIRLWGYETGFKFLVRSQRDQRKADRNYLDGVNWTLWWWIDWIMLSILKRKSRAIYLITLLFAGGLLLF